MELAYLKSRLNYCELTGNFIWLPKPTIKSNNQWNSRFSGKIAGCKQNFGSHIYLTIRVDGKLYLAHRLAFFFSRERWPTIIDHINGNSLDNRIENLREVDKVENGRNCKISKNNTSSVNGVYYQKQIDRWIAEGHYTKDGIKMKEYLGCFKDISDAKIAREKWEVGQGNFTKRHGKLMENYND